MPTQDPTFARKLSDFATKPSPAAARALAALRNDAALPALVKAMNDFMEGPEAIAYREAVRALATPAVLNKWMSGDLEARRTAAQALSARYPEHVPMIALGLRDDDDHVRAVCRRALRSWTASPALHTLFVSAIRHADPRVRLLAAEGLGKLGTAADVPAITAALEAETDDNTRDRIAWALERLDGGDEPT